MPRPCTRRASSWENSTLHSLDTAYSRRPLILAARRAPGPQPPPPASEGPAPAPQTTPAAPLRGSPARTARRRARGPRLVRPEGPRNAPPAPDRMIFYRKPGDPAQVMSRPGRRAREPTLTPSSQTQTSARRASRATGIDRHPVRFYSLDQESEHGARRRPPRKERWNRSSWTG